MKKKQFHMFKAIYRGYNFIWNDREPAHLVELIFIPKNRGVRLLSPLLRPSKTACQNWRGIKSQGRVRSNSISYTQFYWNYNKPLWNHYGYYGDLLSKQYNEGNVTSGFVHVARVCLLFQLICGSEGLDSRRSLSSGCSMNRLSGVPTYPYGKSLSPI